MIFSFAMNGATGEITLTGTAAYGSDAQTLSAFLGNPSCKAAMVIVDERFFEAPEAMFPEKLLNTIAQATIPVAAVIDGDCSGPGLHLACACHFRFAAENSMIHFPDITRTEKLSALLRDMGITPETVADELSGRCLTAEAAMKNGFIDSVTKKGTAGKMASDFLESLTRNRSSQCIRAAMQSIQNSFAMPIEDALREECRLFDERVRESAGVARATMPDIQ